MRDEKVTEKELNKWYNSMPETFDYMLDSTGKSWQTLTHEQKVDLYWTHNA